MIDDDDDDDNDFDDDNFDDGEYKGKRRLTLKNAIAFVDKNYPELIFMVPKNKRWLPPSFSSSVYMVRGDPLASLKLDVGSELSLLPKKITSKHMRRYYLDNPVVVVVDTIDFALSARHAEITVSRYI